MRFADRADTFPINVTTCDSFQVYGTVHFRIHNGGLAVFILLLTGRYVRHISQCNSLCPKEMIHKTQFKKSTKTKKYLTSLQW